MSDKLSFRVKRLRENARIPLRATVGSAGMDLYACINNPVTIEAGKTEMVPTGIAIALPGARYAAFIYARSGLAVKNGLAPANCVGVIDSDYRGEVIVGLHNHSGAAYEVQPGERIAQMVIAPVCLMDAEEAGDLDETDRGDGGFGSTG